MADIAPTPDLLAQNEALRAALEGRIAELERSQRLLHHLLDASPSAIYLKDLDGRFLLVNQQAATIMGRPAEELLGRADHELFPAEYVAAWRAAEDEVRRSGVRIDQEELAPQPDGVRTYFSSRAPVFDETGALFAISGISTDITARIRAEEAQRQAQQHLQLVVDSLPSSVFWKNHDLTYGGCNLAFARDAGLASPAEIVGKSDYDMPWGASEAEAYRAYDRQVMDSGEPRLHIIETQQTAGGAQIWLDTNKVPLRNSQGEVIGLLGTYEDISAQRRTEEALRRSQVMLQTIIDSLPSAVFWKDRDLVYQGCNLTFAGFAGVGSPLEIVGKSDYDMPWAGTEADSYRAYDRKIMDSGEPELHIIETQLQADGRHTWAETNKIPLRDKDGTVIGVLGTYEDITARKQTERELQENRQLLAILFDHLPVAVFLKEAESGRFMLWNAASERLFGFNADQIVGKTDHDLFPREQADGFRAKDLEILASGKTEVIPEEFVDSKSLGRRIVRTTKVPLIDQSGHATYLLVICNDITGERNAAAEQAALQAQIIEAQQHALRELSTPLLPIAGKVVLMPIVGAIDSRRAQQVLETLLHGVAEYNAEVAIVDITGVQVVDTQVANAFIQAARAVQLLGAQVMLTGIRPEVAQTLVQLGVDLQGMNTRGSLQSGIAAALKLSGVIA